MEKTIKQIHLHNTEGNSDKFYDVQLVEENGAWSVNFQYGRTGNDPQTGCKLTTETYLEAEKEYDKLVASKIKKGYKEE